MKYGIEDIRGFANWKYIKEIDEGWSTDRKYYIETKTGEKLLLRVADASLREQKKLEYDRISALKSTGFEMSRPIQFGYCNNKSSVYMLLTWVDGISLHSKLPKLSVSEQYTVGRKAGKILKEIHSVKVVDKNIVGRDEKLAYKLKKISNYEKSYVRVDGDEQAIKYVRENIEILYNTEPTYKHGDFHSGNLIYTNDGELGLIDFNRINCGDRYEDFNKIATIDIDVSVPFAIGVVDGYFEKEPSEEFWKILSVYVAQMSMTAINWAEKFGIEEIQIMQDNCRKAFSYYNNFTQIIPTWYEKINS